MDQNSHDIIDAIERTPLPAMAISHDQTITYWSRGAERLFGVSRADAVGRPCFHLLCGVDMFGNDYCMAECAVVRLVRLGQMIQPFRLQVMTEKGSRVVCFAPIPLPARTTLYIMLDSSGFPFPGTAAEAPPGSPPRSRLADADGQSGASPLTAREVEILKLLSQGLKTAELAKALYISPTTVRNHIQNILGKLGVHSRVEAVAVAERSGWLRGDE